MKLSSERILTTHVGSMPRPPELLDLLVKREAGEPYDHDELDARVNAAVKESVRQQAEAGIDFPSDGEQGKLTFNNYVSQRLAGLRRTTPEEVAELLGGDRDDG